MTKPQSRRPGSGGDPYRRDLARIWGGAKWLGMDEETLRDLVEDLSGKRSISQLTPHQRKLLIQDLAKKGAYRAGARTHGRPGRQNGPQPAARARQSGVRLITSKQQLLIDQLWEQLEKYERNAASKQWRFAFVHRIIGRGWPQKVWEAQQVIEALKKRIKQSTDEHR